MGYARRAVEIKTISNSDDIIDSRDVIERIVYLEADETDEAEQEELDILLALQEDAESYAEGWQHGVPDPGLVLQGLRHRTRRRHQCDPQQRKLAGYLYRLGPRVSCR